MKRKKKKLGFLPSNYYFFYSKIDQVIHKTKLTNIYTHMHAYIYTYIHTYIHKLSAYNLSQK